MQFMPKKIDEQLKAQAERLMTEHRQEYPTNASRVALGPTGRRK
jgi:hypothetical protein